MTARAGEGYRYELVEVAAGRSGELHGEGALLRETRKKRHQMMRRYSAEQKIPRGGAGEYFTGRKRWCTASWWRRSGEKSRRPGGTNRVGIEGK